MIKAQKYNISSLTIQLFGFVYKFLNTYVIEFIMPFFKKVKLFE